MSLQGDGKQKQRVFCIIGCIDDLLEQGLIGGKDAALFHGRHIFLGPEFFKSEGLVNLLAIPEPFLERMHGNG
ncbi:hypothetical protein D3C80_1771250 [compost metagenome]